MSKIILFDAEARNKLKKGIDTLANAVKVTLGPKGRNVVIQRKFTTPHVTKDGVTVARDVELKDPIEEMGANMILEAASKTASSAGDGTTTATILAHAMITEGLKMVAAGGNPIELKRGIDVAVADIVTHIKQKSVPVEGNTETIKAIATVSANNDPEIGELIANAMKEIGSDGIINVQESGDSTTHIKVVSGMQFPRGYLSTRFITNTDKMTVELDNPYILLFDKKISVIKDILPILQAIQKAERSLLIIAEDVEGEALAALIVNKTRGLVKVAAVKSPSFGDMRKEVMRDIAILTGGTYVCEEDGMKLSTIPKYEGQVFGEADRIVITKEDTSIIGGKGDKDQLAERILIIKSELAAAEDPYTKKELSKRIARLTDGVAIMYVGAPTEVELKEKKDRIDDALHAAKAAAEGGIVPGGGIAYIRACEYLGGADLLATPTEDMNLGVRIVMKSLSSPLSIICKNAGYSDEVALRDIHGKDYNYGYNARLGQYEDLLKAGIIDPAKVVISALENAASVAGMVLLTECVMADEPEPDKMNFQVPGDGLPYMGG